MPPTDRLTDLILGLGLAGNGEKIKNIIDRFFKNTESDIDLELITNTKFLHNFIDCIIVLFIPNRDHVRSV